MVQRDMVQSVPCVSAVSYPLKSELLAKRVLLINSQSAAYCFMRGHLVFMRMSDSLLWWLKVGSFFQELMIISWNKGGTTPFDGGQNIESKNLTLHFLQHHYFAFIFMISHKVYLFSIKRPDFAIWLLYGRTHTTPDCAFDRDLRPPLRLFEWS